jgi:hypothetical protein
MILGGIVYILFGLLLLSRPLLSVAVIVWITGISAFIGGIFLIVTAFRIKSIGNQEGTAENPEAELDTEQKPEPETDTHSDTDEKK